MQSMNMWEEKYKKEIERQIDNTELEIKALINDYESSSDDIVKSQIKTFLEKKEFLYLNLMERYNGIIR